MESSLTEDTRLAIKRVFDAQKGNQLSIKLAPINDRKKKLKKLKTAIKASENEIFEALKKDLRKPVFESAVFEVLFIYAEIDFAIKNLSPWASQQTVSSNLLNLMTKCCITYEPKGVCLIIAPWNYPFQLLMSPLVSAIAAGNCCVLKPSELAPATSAVLTKLIQLIFKEDEIAVIEGDSCVSTELLSLPFNHIFFTGSTHVGKIVMEAASKHLSTVTLELGGKSPAIIDEDVDLKKAAEKITWGTFANAGQTCIAPDYVFVHEDQQEKFIDLMKSAIEKKYFNKEQLNKEDYGKIISGNHFKRLKNLFDDALSKAIYPTVLTNVSSDSLIMQEEVFGPVLPVVTYKNITEVINYINANNKPLALYIFSNSNKNVDNILKQTSSGGACINDVMIHISNPHLSFGGINTSGMGGSHGFHGFKAFSHERSVMYQSKLIDISKIIYPPYNGKGMILKLLRKLM
ncbi:MAG: aldehyde dehydrogenase family protein [Bacteroidetes bacterium]|nr:aldehyde dehydrogenase family protein [Bacteroidota bacterium]